MYADVLFPSPCCLSEPFILAFITWLVVSRGVVHSTVKNYLAGVRSYFALFGATHLELEVFRHPRVKLLIRAVRRLSPTKTKPRLPITIWILEILVKFLIQRNAPGDFVVAVAATLGFFGLLRASEFCARPGLHPGLVIHQLQWSVDGTKLTIHLDQSKTDIYREGVDILVFDIPNNASGLCPVSLMRTLLAGRKDYCAADPVFLHNNKPLSYSFFQKRLRDALSRCGFPAFDYGTHSLRIGAATTLAILGFPSHFIQSLGRWKSLSYQLYVRLGEREMRDAMRKMASSRRFSAKHSLEHYPCHDIGTPSLEHINLIRARFFNNA